MTGPVRALFSDVDGTLTTDGRLHAETYAALEQLAGSGVPVILVTGRPAGWGQALMALAPVTAVVAENGGVSFIEQNRVMRKRYGIPEGDLADWRTRMHAAAAAAMAEVPGAQLSSDTAYREVDMAIDWNEEASLPPEQADQVVTHLRAAGLTAVRSSVHVNFSPPLFDKATACVQLVAEVLGGDPDDLAPYVFVGDALNDAPMFARFPRSVGVANVADFWDRLPHRPAFVTESPEGAGLREVIAHVRALTAPPVS